MLELTDVTVRFGGVTPLDTVTVAFSDRVHGLIGPNGAGKTTMLNVLCGLVVPVAGNVTGHGSDLGHMSTRQRARWGLRRTFQTEQLVEHMSAFDNVLISSENVTARGLPGRSVDEVLDFVGLAAESRTVASELSSFGRKRLELARAVVGCPKVLLLDEPAAGVAAGETAQLARIIREVPDFAGAQVVLIDHDVSLVRSVCTALTVLDFGKVIADGRTDAVLNDPAVQRAYLGAEDL